MGNANISDENWQRNDFPIWKYFDKNASADCLNNWKPSGPNPPQSDPSVQRGLSSIGPGKMSVIIPEALQKTLAGELKGSQIADGSGGAALPLVIFITGIPERMPEAFGVRAFHFLVKPVKEEQFRPVLESARKAVAYAKSRQTEKTITLVSGSVTNVLKASDICYVESLGRKLVFHLREGVTESYGKISEIGSELGDTFYQIHRSYFSFKSRTGHPQGCSSASRKNVALCINGNLRMLMFR